MKILKTKPLDLKGIEPRHMGLFLAPFTTARDQRRAAKKGKKH